MYFNGMKTPNILYLIVFQIDIIHLGFSLLCKVNIGKSRLYLSY